MLTFISTDFERKVKECLRYIDEKNNIGFSNLKLEFIDIISDKFNPDEYNNICIGPEYVISFSLDNDYFSEDMTIEDFIDMIDETKSSKLIDDCVCLSEKRCIYRVITYNHKDTFKMNSLLKKYKKYYFSECIVENTHTYCSIINGLTLFNVMINFTRNEKYIMSKLGGEYFIEIRYDKLLNKNITDKIFNSYLFELNTTLGLKLKLRPSPEYELYEDEIGIEEYKLRPLIYGKGINELTQIFNNAEVNNNYDYSILQYTKILEYVSQTVIRQNITSKVQSKLSSKDALRPTANYVKELEELFNELSKQYETDRSAVNAVIVNCCSILEISESAPKYLSKVVALKSNLANPKANKQSIMSSAIDSVADSISDTRDFIAHAKTNYTLKGGECPDDQKGDFVNLVRELSIQAIRWFDRIHEENRVIS